MRFADVGDTITETAGQSPRKPKWLKWINATKLSGEAQTPIGAYQDLRRAVYDWTGREFIQVSPIDLPTTDAPWRATIFAPNGSYITSTSTGDIPTIGTPTVRLTVNAPGKAVIKYPVVKEASKDLLASTFAGWSDGHTEAISRGMEVLVEFRNTKTGTMQTVFRGMIFQIEGSQIITVTAYDGLMMLAQYSDQYQSHAGYTQFDTSKRRTTSGTNYVYTFSNSVGTLVSATSEDILQIDATAAMGHGLMDKSMPQFIAHPLPSVNSYTVQSGEKITHVKAKVYSAVFGQRSAQTGAIFATLTYTAKARIILYQWNNGSMTLVNATDYKTWTCTASGNTPYVSNYAEQSLEWDVDWTVGGSNYIAIEVVKEGASSSIPDAWDMMGGNAYPEYSDTRQTVSGNYYTSTDGWSWSSVSSGDLPEIAIRFQHSGTSTTTSLFSISGSNLTIAQSNVPAGPSDGYLSTYDNGAAYVITYFISGAMGIREIVETMILWAGLYAMVTDDSFGYTDYYTSSTYDYMTSILELINGSGMGIKSSVDNMFSIEVYPRHWSVETPSIKFTTDPSASGEQIILSHDLTAHWASEKATQAYIAENATSSGLPLALETDDVIMTDSMVSALQTPLRSIIADNSLGTHNLMANAAGGKMVQLHTNVVEGSIVISGYRTDIWDFTHASYVGGKPISLNVPESGVNETVVPTEITLGDGVTKVVLDNIRSADRNEISNSMSKTDNAISNGASSLPNTVYIFARIDTYDTTEGDGINRANVTSVSLYGTDTSTPIATQSNSSYIKTVSDSAGYAHVMAVFPTSDEPTGYATSDPIQEIRFVMGGNTYNAYFPNAKYAYAGQNVHVDIRFKTTGIYIPNLML